MGEIVKINDVDMQVKVWKNQRVVTFADIDAVHQRPNGTASRNFRKNRERFIQDIDFYLIEITNDEFRRQFGISKNAGRTITLVTESGYLMLVKSFTDNLAWKVQRELVNSYFKVNEVAEKLHANYPINITELNSFVLEVKESLPCVFTQVSGMEKLLAEHNTVLQKVMDNMTLTTVQQGILQRAVKDRVNQLLGGTHSQKYKENSKTYFANLWNNLKQQFHCGSRWQDLNPRYYNDALNFVSEWEYLQ